MQSSDIPVKFRTPWASAAGAGYITAPIPYNTAGAGRATLTKGFPDTTFIPEASGGNPPWGADMNGILNMATAWLQWAQAGGFPPMWDSTFASEIGGYPLGAVILGSGIAFGSYFVSLKENNLDDPIIPTSWMQMPEVAIQKQTPCYAEASGPTNQAQITLVPIPASWASLIGAPIRFKLNHTNTSGTPTLVVAGLAGAKTMINADGSAIGVGQLVAGCVVDGIYRDDDKFQVNSPAKVYSPPPGSSPWITGVVYAWMTPVAPAGTLECDGSTLLISAYADLFGVLGTRYGGNGTTNFKLPDLRGYFLRGWDHGAGRDLGPRVATPGGNVNGPGTTEGGTAGNIVFANVAATLANPGGIGPSGDPLWNVVFASEGTTAAGFVSNFQFSGNTSHSANVSLNTNVGSGETRPVNTAVMFIIGI